MASSIIYLDESGDLGWKFDAPYRNGGSSRHLTISALEVPFDCKDYPKRIVRKMYQKFKRDPQKEMKWAEMDSAERKHFADLTKEMCATHPDIVLHAIVVQKANVMEHIRSDGNKLYNYMIKLALLERMAAYDVVTMIPDPRSIRVQSGNSLHDYLQTELWFGKKANTKLVTTPIDSAKCLGLQFADMVAGTVQARFEDNQSANFQAISHCLRLHRLFFSA
jgi:hypothetical protein